MVLCRQLLNMGWELKSLQKICIFIAIIISDFLKIFYSVEILLYFLSSSFFLCSFLRIHKYIYFGSAEPKFCSSPGC